MQLLPAQAAEQRLHFSKDRSGAFRSSVNCGAHFERDNQHAVRCTATNACHNLNTTFESEAMPQGLNLPLACRRLAPAPVLQVRSSRGQLGGVLGAQLRDLRAGSGGEC
jgi:hypothetical protein